MGGGISYLNFFSGFEYDPTVDWAAMIKESGKFEVRKLSSKEKNLQRKALEFLKELWFFSKGSWLCCSGVGYLRYLALISEGGEAGARMESRPPPIWHPCHRIGFSLGVIHTRLSTLPAVLFSLSTVLIYGSKQQYICRLC